MRRPAQVRPSFWTGTPGNDLRLLSPEFHLVLNLGSGRAGLYYLPPPTAPYETGSSVQSRLVL